jgi:hypothetical protein
MRKNRHLDEGFLTWNGSEHQLHALFEMPINVHHHHPSIRINTTIGSAVHYIDAYLSHENGVLNTKVYRYPNSHDSSLPDIPHVPMCPDSRLLRAALIRAARSCSNVDDFNDEQRRIKLSYDFQGLSNEFVEQCLGQFLNNFGSPSMTLPISDPIDYNSLRNRIVAFVQRQAAWRAQRKISRKHKFIFHYPADWDAAQVSAIRHILEETFEDRSEQTTERPKQEFEMKPDGPPELSTNDFLVDKRPPMRLLKLAKKDQIETSTYHMRSLSLYSLKGNDSNSSSSGRRRRHRK